MAFREFTGELDSPTPSGPVHEFTGELDAIGYGTREDGSPKGAGFFGPLQSKDPRFPKGAVSTELSADTEVDGKNLFFPLLTPNLSRKEIDSLLSGEQPSDAIYNKAIAHAQQRIASGQSPFAGPGEQVELPNYENPSMGAVALNAVPKGVANLANTPHTINNLVLRGLANLPGMPQPAKDFIQGIADHPAFQKNLPMELMQKIGLVNPENEPQTGPQRIVDMAVQAAVGAAAVPAGGLANVAKQAALGATSGAAAQTTNEATGSDLLAGIVGVATPLAAQAGARALQRGAKQVMLTDTAKMTLKESQQHGFVVEPSQVRQPTSKIETIAGKAAIAQGAVEKNQGIANRLAAKAIGLPPDTPLSPELLDSLKKTAMQPYREVDAAFQQLKQSGNLEYFPRYHSASLMEEFVAAGQEAKALWKSYSRNPEIAVLKAARAADTATESVFKDIERVALASGKPNLANQVRSAKQLYARINDVESAMNVGTGNVSMPALAKMLDNGKALSGELKTVAKFANAFPRAAREIERVPPSGVSGTDAAMSATLGLGGTAAAGNLSGLAAAGLPLLRGPARRHVLTDAYQRSLLQGSAKRWMPQLSQSSTRGVAAMTGKTVADNAEE